MKTMSDRFIKKWKSCKTINPIRKIMPGWMYLAILHDGDIRCKDNIKRIVND